MPESNALVEKRQQFAAKQKELSEVFEAAGSDLDFSKKSVLEKLGASDSADAVSKVKARNVELDNLSRELQAAELAEVKSAIGERDAARNVPVRGGGMTHPSTDLKTRSFGELFVEAKAYTEGWKKNQQTGIPTTIDIGLKTLFETTAGYAPQSVRSGLLVEGVTRPLQLTDLIPERPINQAVDKYMAETTRTHSSAEKAEAAAFAESTFEWTEQTSLVQKITDSVPVTDEQLEDAPEISAILNSRLVFGLRQRLETQILVGDGAAPNLRGFLDAGFGIQTTAKGTSPVFDAIFTAMTLVRFTGRAIPNGIILHPNDWQDIRLTRTADGQYIMGAPSTPGATTLFGIPVVICDAITENTGLVGDFANFCYIGNRRGVDVQIGYSGTQFAEGKKLVRADLRACFTVPRVTAFCSVTGL